MYEFGMMKNNLKLTLDKLRDFSQDWYKKALGRVWASVQTERRVAVLLALELECQLQP